MPTASAVRQGEVRGVLAIRDEQIWTLRAKGWTQRRIAAHFGVDQAVISRAQARVSAVRLAELPRMVDEHRMLATAQLDEAIEVAWRSFRESRTVRRARKPNLDPPPEEGEDPRFIFEASPGNPKFLSEVRNLIAQRSALWGLDVPKKHLIANANLDELSPSEQSSIAAALGLTSLAPAPAQIEVSVSTPCAQPDLPAPSGGETYSAAVPGACQPPADVADSESTQPIADADTTS